MMYLNDGKLTAFDGYHALFLDWYLQASHLFMQLCQLDHHLTSYKLYY